MPYSTHAQLCKSSYYYTDNNILSLSLSLSLSLQTMKVFEHYPEDVLREISRDVRHDTFLANETCEWIVCVCVCVLALFIEIKSSQKTSFRSILSFCTLSSYSQ